MPPVRDLVGNDRDWKVATLPGGWGSTEVARLSELVDAADLPGFVAEEHGTRVGLATFAERPDGIDVVTIQSLVVRVLDGGVDASRRVKPPIPVAGENGVLLRHELQFELEP